MACLFFFCAFLCLFVAIFMPVITEIAARKTRPQWREIHLDGVRAFGCHVNVIARFRLREGLTVSDEQVSAVREGQVRQACFDQAMKYLQVRLHGRDELFKKLIRRGYSQAIVGSVLDQLTQLGYVNDTEFARTRALSASRHKHHGRQRAKIDLLQAGVPDDVADRALNEVYLQSAGADGARMLARKHAARLRKLDPSVARRRLAGMLQRRGFDLEIVESIVEETLGTDSGSLSPVPRGEG
jgi:regulatory protein